MRTNKKTQNVWRSMLGILLLFIAANVHAQIITTYAGTGTAGYSGDGGGASGANLNKPIALAIDINGNMYVNDYVNYVVRKIDPLGIITTFAGNGIYGNTGDGGPATAAELGSVEKITSDNSGNIYICTGGNIRKVDVTGVITNFAGTGTFGGSGDGGPATAADIDADGIAIDGAGNVYISGYESIRKIDASGIISTIAGVFAYSGYSGDGGPASAARLYDPIGLTIDAVGNLYVADNGNHVIRKIDLSGTITTFAGTGAAGYSGDGGPAIAAKFDNVYGLCTSGSNIFVADYNGEIRKIDASNIVTTVAGGLGFGYNGDGIPATAAFLYIPDDVIANNCGELFIADQDNNRVRKVSILDNISGANNICVGSVITLSDPTPGGTWSSSATSIATVGSTGDVTGISPGLATIIYTLGCATAIHVVSVDATPVISGPNTVCVGSSISLSSGALYGTWSSTNTSSATVDVYGTIVGIASGTSTIAYTSFCGSDNYTVTVNPVPAITGTTLVCAGSLTSINCSPGGGTWSSANTSIVTVSPTSFSTADINGVAAGTTTISYTSTNGCSSTVTASVLSNPSISGPSTVCSGSTITLSTSISGGMWSSGSTAIATVTSTGDVTGVSNGVVNIFYTNACGSAFYTVTVGSAPMLAPVSVCMGLGSVMVSGSPMGGTWSSSNTLIATVTTLGISGNGNVSGVSTGTATLSYQAPSGGCPALATVSVTGRPDACITSSFTPWPEFDFSGTGGTTIYYQEYHVFSGVTHYGSITLSPGGTASIPISFTDYDNSIQYCIDSVELNGCIWPGCNCSMGSMYCCNKFEGDVFDHRGVNTTGTIHLAPKAMPITIAPNPAGGSFTISGGWPATGDGTANIEICDMTGRVVARHTAATHNGVLSATIDPAADMSNGIYIVKVTHDGATSQAKLNLQR